MTRVYLILRKPWSKNAFDGKGAFQFGGRWSSPGTRLVYCAEHLSLAMIEYFVHIDADDPPRDLVLATADIPARVKRLHLTSKVLPGDWRMTPPPPELARAGDVFVERGQAAVLIVPSALAPSEANWLINPRHADFRRIRLRPPQPFEYDQRFFTQ